MYQIHNQKFDRCLPVGQDISLFVKNDGSFVGTACVTSHTWQAAQEIPNRVVVMGSHDGTAVLVPPEVRGPGFLMAARRHAYLSRVFNALSEVVTGPSEDREPHGWRAQVTSAKVHGRSPQSLLFQFPIGGASPEVAAAFRDTSNRIDVVPSGTEWVTFSPKGHVTTGSCIRRASTWGVYLRPDEPIGVKVNRKKANAAYRALKDGWAEGWSLHQMFNEEFARSEVLKTVCAVRSIGDYASDAVLFQTGRLLGSGGFAPVKEMTARRLAESMATFVHDSARGWAQPGDARYAPFCNTAAFDALVASGVLVTHAGLTEAFFP